MTNQTQIDAGKVREELISYLCEGNSKEDLAAMVLDLFVSDAYHEFMEEVASTHPETGDYPHVHALVEVLKSVKPK